jgi:hypothetical protein
MSDEAKRFMLMGEYARRMRRRAKADEKVAETMLKRVAKAEAAGDVPGNTYADWQTEASADVLDKRFARLTETAAKRKQKLDIAKQNLQKIQVKK